MPIWCIVEDFYSRVEESEYTCKIFDHDCPVFYIAESFIENSKNLFAPKDNLKDSLINCKFYTDENIKSFNIFDWKIIREFKIVD